MALPAAASETEEGEENDGADVSRGYEISGAAAGCHRSTAISVRLDFAQDPVIGHKDQQCDTALLIFGPTLF